ncbi:MAG TPA: hypothetical protein VIM98_19015 [Dyella sp.]|uniref:hypothetical protein n=1 Tax=Dyella sp. TaxID=1869338 RepID=UPI002F93F251
MRRILTVLVPLCALALAGCATDKRSDTLTTTLNAYQHAIRWDGFASAAKFMDAKVLEEHPITPIEQSRFEQYRVTDYDEGQGPMPAGENEMRQVVTINLVNVHTQAERSIVDRQTWHYDGKGHWWLTSGLPDLAPAN